MSSSTSTLNLPQWGSKIVCISLLLLAASLYNVNAFSFQLSGSSVTTRLSPSSLSTKTTTPYPSRSIGRPFQSHPLTAGSINDADTSSNHPHTANSVTTSTTSGGNENHAHTARKGLTTLALLSVISLSSLTPSLSNNANAYDPSDYASDTVTNAVKMLKDSKGNNAGTMKAFENIAEIITEGKGVGGSLSYSGVNLERGYVADEDTSIYNPGLSILTESEKERILDAVRETRKNNKAVKKWTSDSEFAYDFLKDKLDPLHMTELKGYLGILPYYGAVLYVGSLAVQQFVRDSFPFIYLSSAVLVFLPIVGLVVFSS